MPKNRFGQEIEIGDVVTHTSASSYAQPSIGVVRGFREYENWCGIHYDAKVTWVWHAYHGLGVRIKTQVQLDTVTKVDPTTLSQDIQDELKKAMA